MNYKKLIGFGILLWIVGFAIASVFVASNAMDTLTAKLTVPLLVGITAFLFGKNLKLTSALKMLKYSGTWVAIALVLDVLITVRFAGWAIFIQWDVLLGYFLALTAPILATKILSK